MVSQWPLPTVLKWMAMNDFSPQWQDTFKALHLQGGAFLELGSRNASRGNLGMMHKQVYPRLQLACLSSNTVWDSTKEREEGKRLRRLIRYIVAGVPPEQAQTTSHSRNDSANGPFVPSSTATDKSESPNVSNAQCHFTYRGLICFTDAA